MYTYMFIHICKRIFIYLYRKMCRYQKIFMYTSILMYTYKNVYTCICIHVCIYICIYVYIYICTYINIYKYIICIGMCKNGAKGVMIWCTSSHYAPNVLVPSILLPGTRTHIICNVWKGCVKESFCAGCRIR